MKLLVIDGNSILNRAFYGIRMLTTRQGEHTNAVYGFLSTMFKFLDQINPDYLCVCFDLPGKTFRHQQYDQYKATRKGMPPELASQMPIIKQVLSAMNITCLQLPGYEADDIIGTVSAFCDLNKIECFCLTGDKDDLQLCSPFTNVILQTGKGDVTIYDPQAVIDRFGVTPEAFIDLKGLMGDPSDNIPGVPGIGEKTASTLLKQFGSIQGVYENIDNIKGATRKKLVDGQHLALLSKQLATIIKDVPVAINLENMKLKPYDSQQLRSLFIKLEFHSFLKRLEQSEQIPSEITEHTAEMTCLPYENQPLEHEIYYYLEPSPEQNMGNVVFLNGDVLYQAGIGQMEPVFKDPAITKVGCDIKSDMAYLEIINYFDLYLAAYVVDPSDSKHTLERLAADHLGMDNQNPCLSMKNLKEKFCEKLEQYGQLQLFFDIEIPLVKVLFDMERHGIAVCGSMLADFSHELSSSISNLENNIIELAGESFNINSPKQLAVILFEKMGLPVIKKTKSGYSTNVDVLEKLKKYSPIAQYLLEYRSLVKLKGTYADGLPGFIKNGRIHSTFNQTITQTGRISSQDPNVQNIPVRQELGRKLRKAFVAGYPNGYLVAADYSQIELRVLAHMSGDKAMIDAFNHSEDIHTITAAEVFGVPIANVTREMRYAAKAVNFGIVYGISDFALSEDLGITVKEAKGYIQRYLETYSGVRDYLKNAVEKAKEQGFVVTLLNRRRYIPELTSSNHNLRSFGERVAMNAPIQGSAADIIKIAMINVHKALQGMQSKMALQVHDEIIIDTANHELDRIKEILQKKMTGAYTLSVPLVAELRVGKDWYQL